MLTVSTPTPQAPAAKLPSRRVCARKWARVLALGNALAEALGEFEELPSEGITRFMGQALVSIRDADHADDESALRYYVDGLRFNLQIGLDNIECFAPPAVKKSAEQAQVDVVLGADGPYPPRRANA